jgi:RNA polymerase sigma factor (sigma-70 family)
LGSADAEDLVHEAMVRAVQRENLDCERAGAFLYRTASNLAIDWQRREALARRLPPPAPAVTCAESTALERMESRRIAGLVTELSPRERQVFIRRVLGDGPTEAAARLRITTKAAERALGKARKKLRAGVEAAQTLLGLRWITRRHEQSGLIAMPLQLAAITGATLLMTASPSPAVRVVSALDLSSYSAYASRTSPRPVSPPQSRGAAGTALTTAGSGGTGSWAAASTVAVVGGIGDPKGGHNDGVTVTHYDQNEDMIATAERCLSSGPSLALDHLGCPP